MMTRRGDISLAERLLRLVVEDPPSAPALGVGAIADA
jgi:hypothetical protein